MNAFDNREQAFENKFGYDEELEFRVAAHMAQLFGAWAAQQLGLTGAEAQAYIDAALNMEVTKKSGRAELIACAERDLKAKNLAFTRHRLEKEMESCHARAQAEIAGASRKA